MVGFRALLFSFVLDSLMGCSKYEDPYFEPIQLSRIKKKGKIIGYATHLSDLVYVSLLAKAWELLKFV